MRRVRFILAALAAMGGAGFLGCATPVSTADQIRKTADGGTLLITNGTGQPAEARAAVNAMNQHCRNVFEVTEMARTDTGQTVASGTTVAYYGVASSSASASKVYATGITYECRQPRSTDLNR